MNDKILVPLQLFQVDPPLPLERAYLGAGTSLPWRHRRNRFTASYKAYDGGAPFGQVPFCYFNGVVYLKGPKFEETRDVKSSDPS